MLAKKVCIFANDSSEKIHAVGYSNILNKNGDHESQTGIR